MTDKTQSEKFKELAREVGADEDEGRWDDRLRQIVTRHPEADAVTPEDGPPANR